MESEFLTSFIHIIFLAFVALFPPVNPVGTALIVEPFLHHLSDGDRKRAALTIATYCFFVCLCALLIGGVFFHFFGISIPVVQLAGGILICKMGWTVLSTDDSVDHEKDVSPSEPVYKNKIQSLLFYPLAFPTTTGGGTIAVLLTLSAANYEPAPLSQPLKMAALSISCALMAALIFVCYYFAPVILRRLGDQGHQVVNKLSGFLTFCVGIQIFVNGILGLLKQYR